MVAAWDEEATFCKVLVSNGWSLGFWLGVAMSSLGLFILPAAGVITSITFRLQWRFWNLSYALKHFLHILPNLLGSPPPPISVSASTSAWDSSPPRTIWRNAFYAGTTCSDEALWRLLLSVARLVISLPQPRQYTGVCTRDHYRAQCKIELHEPCWRPVPPRRAFSM